jgi:integrase
MSEGGFTHDKTQTADAGRSPHPQLCADDGGLLCFFYRTTLDRAVDIERIRCPRREKKLPIILSKEEVKALLTAPKNLGHRAILAALYGSGRRVSEVTRLKVADLDRGRGVIWVRKCGRHRPPRGLAGIAKPVHPHSLRPRDPAVPGSRPG